MADVMIRCPVTGEAISTEIGMDFEVFKMIAMSNNSVRCPSCQQVHVWDKKDAFPDS